MATPTIGFCVFGCVWYWLKKPVFFFTIYLIFTTIYGSYYTISIHLAFGFICHTFNKKKFPQWTLHVCVFLFYFILFRIYFFQLNMKFSTQIEDLIHYFIKKVGGQQIIRDFTYDSIMWLILLFSPALVNATFIGSCVWRNI